MRRYIKAAAWTLLALSAGLGIISYCLLPDTVITQFSVNESNVSTMPKLIAVFLPTALGAGGALFCLFVSATDGAKFKSVFVSVVGIIVFAIMLIVNM